MKEAKSKSESKKPNNRLAVKKREAPAKKTKEAKDPDKPKIPASAYFVFMEDFREQFKEKHPNNKSVAAVGQAGGAKWKSLTEAEKAPYVEKAEERRSEYDKTLLAYNKKLAEGKKSEEEEEEEESDKSKSEVHDDEEGDSDDSAEEDDDEEEEEDDE